MTDFAIISSEAMRSSSLKLWIKAQVLIDLERKRWNLTSATVYIDSLF